MPKLLELLPTSFQEICTSHQKLLQLGLNTKQIVQKNSPKNRDITARRIKQEETHMAIIIWNMCLKVKIHWTWLKISAPVEYEINHPGIVLN